ncbi:MFS transporter [Pseudodesulfovibrio senegalensis]|uniref:MFS transporter n=1 Tax=Pseudodesulfovibrio senegalensis TaxID=1721087 RepID=A0A6N6N3B3_9BACT|nr:MFS transporter [Pseudodesulfovibrio senegalensis]KAB1441532.1 MFS transporter [Pseudodesulfovibrio senegalensis]
MKPTFVAVLACVGVGTFMSRLDAYIVSVALPSMGEVFGRDMGAMSGVMLFYLLALASSMLIIGSLGDRFGLRRTILAGYGLFSAMSLLCSLTPGLDMLIAARFLQGLGAALLLVASYSLVPTFIKAKRVGSAIGMMNMVGSLGVLLGAPLGGVMTQWLGWESVFLVNVPLGLTAMGLCWHTLPPDSVCRTGRPAFDWLGALLSMAGLWGVVLGLDLLRKADSATSAAMWGATGIACLIAFVWHERRIAAPLVDLDLFMNPVFSYALLAKVFAFIQMSIQGYVMPFYLDWSRGYTTQGTGAVLAIFPVILSIVAPYAGRLSDRNEGGVPLPVLTTLGMTGSVLASGFFVMTLDLDANWPTCVFLALSGLSYAFFLSPNAKLILTNMPERSRAVGTSIFTTATNVGMAIGVPLAVLMFHLAGGESITAQNVDNLKGFKSVYTANALCGLVAAGFALASLRGSYRRQKTHGKS